MAITINRTTSLDGAILPEYMPGLLYMNENQAHKFVITCTRGGSAVTLTGGITGRFMRADGQTILLSGSISSGKANLTLPQSCYIVPGRFTMAIFNVVGNAVTTIYALTGNVARTQTDTLVDPGNTVPTIDNLLAEIDAMRQATADAEAAAMKAVRYDTAQSLTDANKATARGNIDAAGLAQVVRHDASQNLTETQKTTARGNIEAESTDDALEIKTALNEFHFFNVGAAAIRALTVSKSGSTYTVTRNNNSFAAYGFIQTTGEQIGIGTSNKSNITYPIPTTISGSVSGLAVLCALKNDTTENTWRIISASSFRENAGQYIVLCYLYNAKIYAPDETVENFFTNSYTNNSALNFKNDKTEISAAFNSLGCNFAAPIRGKFTYNPDTYTLTISSAILAPDKYPGSFISGINGGNDVVLSWANEAHPAYLRIVYYDTYYKAFYAYSNDTYNDTTFEDFVMNEKPYLAIVCMIYNGEYVFTSSNIRNVWFIGDKDIYAKTENDIYNADLYKAFRKVGVVGDSLSVGYMYNKQTETATSRMLQYSWPKNVMVDAGMPWLNLGTSGQNVLTWCSNGTYGMVQAEASGNKCQAYIIGLGENDQSDSTRGIPLGTPADIDGDYTHVASTYYGGYVRIIEIIKHINPSCKIFCLTNPRTGGNRAAYNVAVRYIADTYYSNDSNVILCDLASDYSDMYNGSSFLANDAATIEGGHYSAIGYCRIAKIMEKIISDKMESNYETMYNIAFIPYDTAEPTANTMTE